MTTNLLILQSEINFQKYKVCHLFLTTLRTGVPRRFHSDLSHPAKFRDAEEKLYIKLCQDTLPLWHFFSIGHSCVGGRPALQHRSLSSYQPQVAASHLFPHGPLLHLDLFSGGAQPSGSLAVRDKAEQGSREVLLSNFNRIFFIP